MLSKGKISSKVDVAEVSQDSINCYLKKIASYPLLSAKDEYELAKEMAKGDEKAKQKLVNSNLRLVVSIAKKHTYSGLTLADLVQEGNLGLMIAVDKFNYKYGNRFSTYAVWWIKQTILKSISEQSYGIKIPVYVQETISKYSKLKTRMEQQQDCEVNVETVAKKMNVEVDKIENYLGAFVRPISVDCKIAFGDGSEVVFGDILEDKRAFTTSFAEFDNLKKDVDEILNNLKDREEQVIRMRFGIGEVQKQTLEEIGNLYGVTKECIRQTELRAIKKLRDSFINDDSLYVYLS